MTRLLERRWFRFLLGALALVGTLALAYYQRRTGPTWPVRVSEELAGGEVRGRLPRTHAGDGDAGVALAAAPGVAGELVWRRFPTDDAWTRQALSRQGDRLVASLPHQPPAAKLEYSVRLATAGGELVLPASGPAVIRFRGEVPAWLLIPHVLLMFVALVLVLRALLGALLDEPRLGRFVPYILGCLVAGGFVLGPAVQKLAFGDWWTGWPFGTDWTDNKTLAALVAWLLAAAVARYRPRRLRPVVLLAAAVMLAVYLIPHSYRGSQLDWAALETAGAGAAVTEAGPPPAPEPGPTGEPLP